MPDSTPMPIEIDVESVASMKKRGDDFVLLDVREQDEHDFSKIEGSQLLPMSELQSRLAELEPHRNRHIVVHCHHGGRSLRVTQMLRSEGFSSVQNMSGGINAWSEQVDASVPRY